MHAWESIGMQIGGVCAYITVHSHKFIAMDGKAWGIDVVGEIKRCVTGINCEPLTLLYTEWNGC